MPDETRNEHGGPETTFEDALSELQRIAGDLESGTLGLEESLARFEQGVALLRKCSAILERAEQRIEILTGRDAEGNPGLTPFNAAATAQQTGEADRRPRTKPERPQPERSQQKSRAASETTVIVTEEVIVETEPGPPRDEDADGPRLF